MLSVYQDGLTPNPDIWCNERIKFGAFLQHINTASQTDLIATGHYARVKHDGKGMTTLNNSSCWLCLMADGSVSIVRS